jgi:hypothetical protein
MNIIKVGTLAALSLGLVLSSSIAGYAQLPNHPNFDKNHPRRAEVLGRDGNINRRLNADRGNLDGHIGQLKREDARVHRQERRDARRNGGHITKGEQHQLNHEENHINQQIRHDH